MIFLSPFGLVVKTFIISTHLLAAEHNEIQTDFFISKGEQIELNVGSVKNFSVGNKEVLKYIYQESKGKLLVKGKSLGVSDIITWTASGKRQNWRIYVLSKREHLNKAAVAEAFEKNGLRAALKGNVLYVSGVISTISSFKTVVQARNNKQIDLILNLTISNELRNKIIANIYTNLYWQGADRVNCSLIEITFYCKVYGKVDTKKFETEYGVNFSKRSFNIKYKNYNLSFILVHIEDSDGRSLSSGLDRIEASLSETLRAGTFQSELGNILLEENSLIAKTLATPTIDSILDKKFQIQVGGEIPFKKSIENDTLEWKFAGLRISGNLTQLDGQLLLDYSSELTVPQEEGVQGPKGKSTLFIKEGSLKKLFSIDVDNLNTTTQSIPLLNKIPILKSLFSTTKTLNTKKKILCFIKVTRQEEM